MNAPLKLATYRNPPTPLLRVCEETSAYDATPPPDVTPESASEWTQVHDQILHLAIDRARHERDLCRWLLAAERLAVPTRAGHASLREYADRMLGLTGRETEERLRVARALAALPDLDAALAAGTLSWSAVRELTRIATPTTERAWLDWAKGRRAQQIEAAVAAHHPGDTPRDRPDPAIVKHRLRFDVRAETLALFRDLQARVRADLGTHADDDTLLYEIARRALGGPADEGRASYQVAITRCPSCTSATIDAGGGAHPVDATVADMAACDSQLVPIESPHVGATPAAAPRAARATQTIPPATRRLVLRRDHKRCIVPGCTNYRYLDVHHLDPRAEGGTHAPDRLAALCGAHHRAVHLGHLVIGGTGTAGFTFHLTDGTPYGAAPPSARNLDISQQALAMLEHLGFKPTRARELLAAGLAAGAAADLESLVRAALRAS
jgi:hypothetical protein